MSGKAALFVVLAIVGVAFSAFWYKHARARWAGWPNWKQLFIGAVTDFFDMLGIGSFATTTSLYKLGRVVDDRDVPGTLNVGHTIPTFAEAYIFIDKVTVDPRTLVVMIASATLGAVFGAPIVARFSAGRGMRSTPPARNAAGNAFECERAAATLVAHPISGAKNRTILAPPGQSPAETHGRRDIVRGVFVQLFFRIWRMFADKFDECQ